MNAAMTDPDTRVWAYVHDEMDDGARRLFERDLASDGRLRALVAAARGLDRRIRSSLSAFENVDDFQERLAEDVLVAWERDRAGTVSAAGDARNLVFPLGSTWRRLFMRPVCGLAAAAAILLMAAPFVFDSGRREALWHDPVFRPLVYRSARAPAKGTARIDASAAQRGQKALRAALERLCRERRVTLPAGLAFSVVMQELRGGAFSVAVQARWRDGKLAGEWEGDYSAWEAFLNNLDASAAGIAETLAVGAGNPVRQEGTLYGHP